MNLFENEKNSNPAQIEYVVNKNKIAENKTPIESNNQNDDNQGTIKTQIMH
jgi:hypothetical protein